MTRRASTRNPVRVRAVQFSSRLVGRNGCGQGRRDSGRLRPAPVFGLRPATAQLGPEKSAGCSSGTVFQIECHALPVSLWGCGKQLESAPQLNRFHYTFQLLAL
jgi:hypothetical protein